MIVPNSYLSKTANMPINWDRKLQVRDDSFDLGSWNIHLELQSSSIEAFVACSTFFCCFFLVVEQAVNFHVLTFTRRFKASRRFHISIIWHFPTLDSGNFIEFWNQGFLGGKTTKHYRFFVSRMDKALNRLHGLVQIWSFECLEALVNMSSRESELVENESDWH